MASGILRKISGIEKQSSAHRIKLKKEDILLLPETVNQLSLPPDSPIAKALAQISRNPSPAGSFDSLDGIVVRHW